MAITSKVEERTDFTTGEVTLVPTTGDAVATVAWASESDIDLPVGGGVPGVLAALRASVNEARAFRQYLPELNRSAEPTTDELAEIARDLGRG